MENVTENEFDKVFNVNAKSVYLLWKIFCTKNEEN